MARLISISYQCPKCNEACRGVVILGQRTELECGTCGKGTVIMIKEGEGVR